MGNVIGCVGGPEFMAALFVIFVLPIVLLIVGVRAAVHAHRDHRADRLSDLWARGICVRCGYDLRMSPVRCPECGQIVPSLGGFQMMVSDDVTKWCEAAGGEARVVFEA